MPPLFLREQKMDVSSYPNCPCLSQAQELSLHLCRELRTDWCLFTRKEPQALMAPSWSLCHPPPCCTSSRCEHCWSHFGHAQVLLVSPTSTTLYLQLLKPSGCEAESDPASPQPLSCFLPNFMSLPKSATSVLPLLHSFQEHGELHSSTDRPPFLFIYLLI